jgi:hypothetical protein
MWQNYCARALELLAARTDDDAEPSVKLSANALKWALGGARSPNPHFLRPILLIAVSRIYRSGSDKVWIRTSGWLVALQRQTELFQEARLFTSGLNTVSV